MGVTVRGPRDQGDELEVAEGFGPQWLPSGAEISFWRSGNIVVHHLTTGAERIVARGYAHAWSPDGRRLAFEHDGSIWVKEIASGRETRIAANRQLVESLVP